jgi:hypothetical protein
VAVARESAELGAQARIEAGEIVERQPQADLYGRP